MSFGLVKYSPLCDTDRTAYLEYLSKFSKGHVTSVGCSYGAALDEFGVGVGGSRLGDVGEWCICGVGGNGRRGIGGSEFLGGSRLVGEAGFGPKAVGSECEDVGGSEGEAAVVGETGTVNGSGEMHSDDVGGPALESVRRSKVVSLESPVGVAAKGGKKPKRGKNQRDREKYRQEIGAASWRKADVGVVEKTELRVSLEKKWAAQNELAAEKARKDLEYQRARDVDAEARKSRARLMKETESSKVATEKAFAFLKSTGNVAGFCETVVSDSSSPGLTDGSSPSGSVPGCTISPDSSASMHEFREAQKKIADQEFQIKKLTRQLALGKLSAGEEAAFTVHSDGEVSDDVKEAIAKCKNDFFDVDTNDDGFEDEKPRTLFAKRVAIPGADEYLYDNY